MANINFKYDYPYIGYGEKGRFQYTWSESRTTLNRCYTYSLLFNTAVPGCSHITMDIEIIPTTEAKQPSQSTSFVLRPVSRNIPTGKNLNPDSLSMHAEYARYPLSTTEVKIAVFNHSQQKYTCGNDYSLAFYNNSNQQWEALPTSPAFEDIGWVLLPKYPPHQQTIKLYTSEVPNRPGKYRIYKTFYRDTKEVTYAEFEIFSNLK